MCQPLGAFLERNVAGRDAEAVTGILRRVEAGDRDAVDELFHAVYDELHLLASRTRSGSTMLLSLPLRRYSN